MRSGLGKTEATKLILRYLTAIHHKCNVTQQVCMLYIKGVFANKYSVCCDLLRQYFYCFPFSLSLLFSTISHQIEVQCSPLVFAVISTNVPVEGSHGNLSFCGDWLDPRGHALAGIFWECQNSAQRQLITLWQIHTNLHGGVSRNKSCLDVSKYQFCVFRACVVSPQK